MLSPCVHSSLHLLQDLFSRRFSSCFHLWHQPWFFFRILELCQTTLHISVSRKDKNGASQFRYCSGSSDFFFCACQMTFYIFVSRKDNWSFSVSILLPLNDVGIRVRGSYFRTARVGRQLFPSALGGRTPAMPCTRHRPLERWSTSMPTLTPAWRTCTPRHRFKNWLFPSDQDQDLWKNLSLTIYMGTRFHIWPPAIVIHLVLWVYTNVSKNANLLNKPNLGGITYVLRVSLFAKYKPIHQAKSW